MVFVVLCKFYVRYSDKYNTEDSWKKNTLKYFYILLHTGKKDHCTSSTSDELWKLLNHYFENQLKEQSVVMGNKC